MAKNEIKDFQILKKEYKNNISFELERENLCYLKIITKLKEEPFAQEFDLEKFFFFNLSSKVNKFLLF